MIAVIFEVQMRPGREQEYFDLAAALRAELAEIDGFISIERFQSLATAGKYLSISFWRDEAAVTCWKANAKHQAAQTAGKERIFSGYRIRVAEVIRDYGND